MSDRPLESAREGGLIRTGEPLLVLLSGGGDSVCLLDLAMRIGAQTSALHVNYGLRPTADGDEEFCRRLCNRLGVPLTVERVELPPSGNLQAEARDARYALAEAATRRRLRRRAHGQRPGRDRALQAGGVARRPCAAWSPGAGAWCGRCSK